MGKWTTSQVDFEMAEHCAKVLYDTLINGELPPEEESLNFLYSLARLTANNIKPGPKVEYLEHEVNALFAYTDIGELYGFTVGAVYGSTKFYEAYSKVIGSKVS